MCHCTNTFGASFAEQNPCSGTHKFRMSDEAEQHRRRTARRNTFLAHDAFKDGRLSDTSDVDGCLEALVDGGCVMQHGHRRLEEVTAARFVVVLDAEYYHTGSDVGQVLERE